MHTSCKCKSIDIYAIYRSDTKIWEDGHMDSQRDTIIPRHYHVAGYKEKTIGQLPKIEIKVKFALLI